MTQVSVVCGCVAPATHALLFLLQNSNYRVRAAGTHLTGRLKKLLLFFPTHTSLAACCPLPNPPPRGRELRGCWVFGGRFWQAFVFACYLYRFSHLTPSPMGELRGCWVFGGRFWQTFGLACYLYRFSHLTPSPVGEGWGGYNLITSFTS